MKKFFKNLAMACLAALSCVAIGLGTGCEAVNSVLGTFESLGGHIGNVIDKVTHECEYNVMKHDADNHWNECECGKKDETSVAAHVYDNACDTTCNVCGAERKVADHVYDNACDKTCNECGAEREITHDYSKYASNETNHWKVCSVCGVKDETTVEAHTGGEATATEQAKCEVCGAPYGKTLPYVTAALTLDGDATTVTIPAGKYAQVSVNTMFETIVLEFSENVTVTVDGEEVKNGAVVEYNYRTSIAVTPVNATAETVATLKASTYVDPSTILTPGTHTVNGTFDGESYTFTGEVGKAYDLIFDSTVLIINVEYSNGVTDSYVSSGYVIKVEEGVSITIVSMCAGWGDTTGEITIAAHTTHTYVWMKDLNNHWQGCGCGVVVDGTKAAHTYDYECSDTCNVCNAYRFDAASHDYTVDRHDKDGHWKECVCGTRDYSSYEAHYGGTATDSEQAVCEGCGESYGDTLTTAFKDLRIDFPYGLIQLTVPAGKILVVNLLIEENAYLKITFEGDVTVMFGRQPVASGDVIKVSNVMHTLTVIANDTTVDTVVKMNADTFVVKNGELVLGENEVEAIASPELEFVFTAEEANTYTITADDTLWLYLKTENGSETVDSCYTFTLEAGASITFIIIPSDRNSQATGKVTIAVKTAEEHTHSYTTLKSDADNHWYECECGEKDETSVATHDYDNTCDTTCNVCGAERAIEHTYDNACDADCNVCGATRTPADHVYDNPCDTTCNVCGAEREITHDYSKYASDGTNHWKVCSVCSVKDEATVAAHTGGTATYTKKAVCEVCHKAYGSVVIPQKQAEIVDAAYSLAKGETLTSGKYTLTGVIASVDTAYSSSYKNVTVTIRVAGKEDKPIKCFRLKGTGADEIGVGDKITVTGTLMNYNGTVEFKEGCTLDSYVINEPVYVPTTPEEIVDAAYALKAGNSLAGGPFTLSGVISSVDEAFSSQYNNVTVTIKVAGKDDKPIKCFRLKGTGADVIAVGDTITVKGELMNYDGTIEFTPCTLEKYTLTDAHKVAADAAALKLPVAQLTEVGASIDLVTAGENGLTITWALKAECANVSLADGKLTVESLPTEDVEVVLVATLTLNDASTTKELTVTVLKSGSVVEETADYTLSFASKGNRTEYSTTKQVWKQNGVTLTNDKASSTTDVADYVKPVKLYAHSSVTIACTGMKKIVFNCNSTGYATALKNSISSSFTVSVDGKVVTVTFTENTDSLKIANLSAQVRLDSIVVTAVVGA